jgi:hypothetical protein
MMFFLKLNPVLGSLIAILISVAFTCAIFIAAHILLGGRRPKETRVFAQQMALRIGTLHALIIAFVFGALASDYIDLEKTMDNEAAAIGSVYAAMRNIQSGEAEKIRDQVVLYLKDVIDKEWELTSESPLSTSTGQILFAIIKNLENWQTSLPFEEKIKNYSIDTMLTVNQMRIKRLYGWYREDVPAIFWLIALIGFTLTLFPYLSVELTKFRLILVNCYSSMVGITFYGLILLNNPFACGLVAPTPHKMMYEQIKSLSLSNEAHLPKLNSVLAKNIQSDEDPAEPKTIRHNTFKKK